jgi:hypothetical protein
MLDQVGAAALQRAVVEALALGNPTLRAVHHLLDKHLRESGQTPAVAVPISDPRFADVVVRPHALSSYDRIHQEPEHEES